MLVVDPTIAGVEIPLGNLKFDADQAGDAAWRVVDVCHFAEIRPREPMRQELGVRVLERDLRAACGRVSGGAKKPAFRLFLDDSLRARLVPDRAGVLGDGECYLSVDGVPREGYVLVMRDPSYFSACVRVLRLSLIHI